MNRLKNQSLKRLSYLKENKLLIRIFKDIDNWFQRQEKENRTRKELNSLSDRDLQDIGLSRYDIDRISRHSSWSIKTAGN